MTQTQGSGATQPPPFATMLRATVKPMSLASPVIVLVFWATRQTRGGLAALLGVSIALAFFASGLYVMKRITNANPLSVLAGALAVYLGQMIFLGIVIFGLSDADWLDGLAFGMAILAVAVVWQVVQVVAFVRLRQPVYDGPVNDKLGDDEPVDEQSTPEPATEQLSTPRPLS